VRESFLRLLGLLGAAPARNVNFGAVIIFGGENLKKARKRWTAFGGAVKKKSKEKIRYI